MSELTLWSELLKTVPVVVGGLLAIAGGAGGQVLVHRLAERRDRAKLRRERLESLVKAIYAHGQWLDDQQTKKVFRNEDHDTPNPLDEASMLQSLYFPQLARELSAILQAQIPLITFFNEQRLKHMKNKEQFIAEWNPAPFTERYKDYLAAVNALVQKARTLLF